MGRSARDVLNALLTGEADPAVLAELARGRMRSKRDLLAQALQGQLKSHHRFLIAEQLAKGVACLSVGALVRSVPSLSMIPFFKGVSIVRQTYNSSYNKADHSLKIPHRLAILCLEGRGVGFKA